MSAHGDVAGVVTLDPPNVLNACSRLTSGTQSARIRPHALADVPDLQVQQGLIIKDLMFVLLGLEGLYVRYSERYQPLRSLTDRVEGPEYKTAKHLDISLKSITKKLWLYGKYYAGLKLFREVYDTEKSGKVVQALCQEIGSALAAFEQLVLKIEQQFAHTPGFNMSYLENNVLRPSEVALQLLLYYEVACTVHKESLRRMGTSEGGSEHRSDAYFDNFIEAIQNDLRQTGAINLATDQTNFDTCKGGLVLQIVQALSTDKYVGDFARTAVLGDLFETISKDYVHMLNAWLLNGDINDPFDEFLVKENKMKDKFSSAAGLLDVHSEKYWEEVYVTRTDGVIAQLQSRDLQVKLTSTGRFLNVFKMCTGVKDTSALMSCSPIVLLSSPDFELQVLDFYSRANRLLMKLYVEGYQLTNLVDTLQFTFFSKDSHHIHNFIHNAFNTLQKNRLAVSARKLAHQFEDEAGAYFGLEPSLVLEQTNFYDLAVEILSVQSFDAMEAMSSSSSAAFKSLLNKSLERQPPTSAASASSLPASYDPDHSDDYAITALNLVVSVPFPLRLMVGENYVFQYQLIFKLTVLTKFIGAMTDNTWKETISSNVWRYKGYQPHVGKLVLRSKILLNRMADLMRELEYYFNVDIIEDNYKNLKVVLDRIETTLQQPTLAAQTTAQQSLTGQYTAFDRNIIEPQRLNGRTQTSVTAQLRIDAIADIDINQLRDKIGSFLNNILRHLLITNRELIASLKAVFDVIILYNHYLMRLKKSMVLLDAGLFAQFKRDYPDRFEDKSVDTALITDRYDKLNARLNWYFETFAESLTGLMNNLRRFGETDDHALLILCERLEHAFPE